MNSTILHSLFWGGNAAIVGLRTESTVFEIQEPIENGLIPKPRESDAEPLGRMVAELRCLDDGRIDKTKAMQILVGTRLLVGDPGLRSQSGLLILRLVR